MRCKEFLFFFFSLTRKSRQKAKRRWVYIYSVIHAPAVLYIYMLNSYTNTLVLCTGEIAGIVLSLLLLAFVGGFVCAFVVVRRRQVSVNTFHASLKFCHSLVQTC